MWVALVSALPGLILGGWSLLAQRKGAGAAVKKTEAETESIHQQVADRWAEHVAELQETVARLQKQSECDKGILTGLHLDIAQVRRENEQYRQQLEERDAVIADLKDWASRLIRQLATHAPDIEPEPYRKIIGDDTMRRLRRPSSPEE